MGSEIAMDIGPDSSLLLVDDDEPFVKRLARAMEKRGFTPETAESVADGRAKAIARPPAYAVIDLRLSGARVGRLAKFCRPKWHFQNSRGYLVDAGPR